MWESNTAEVTSTATTLKKLGAFPPSIELPVETKKEMYSQVLALAKYQPKSLIALLNAEIKTGQIKQWNHPVLGDLQSIMQTITLNQTHYAYQKNPVVLFLKSYIREQAIQLAKDDPHALIDYLNEEKKAQRTHCNLHFILGPLGQFKTDIGKQCNHALSNFLSTMIKHETYVVKSLMSPESIRDILRVAHEKGLIKKGIHPELGNLRSLADDIDLRWDSQDAGKQRVVSYIESIICYYPSAQQSP